ncbi:MAG: DUF4293 domain-containing protein [Prevotellaceae bacterium]|jgi:hypothetical protein|nr:DUF4293 domain-containing protein [Prevotellaceae bacterium]
MVIQRIQTLYLLIVTVLQIILFFSRIAGITASGEETIVYKTLNYWPMAVLAAITAILAFFSIFLFKRYIIQIRICVYNIILLLALQGYLIYYLLKLSHKVEVISYSIPVVLPLVSAILVFLTIRSIGKDIASIKAADRIRR